MSVRRTFIRNAFMVACAATLGLSVGVAAQAATPKNMLVISKSADPQMLDIAVTMDNNDWSITYPSYQRLIKYKAGGSTEVEGELAKSWTTSADKLTWTFTLNDGQKFSDGTPVNAQAVKYSFDRLMKMKQGPSEPFPAGLQVTVKDPLTVEFKLDKPFAPFLNILANNGAGIVNPAVEQKAGGADKYLAGHTAGSGPYQLAKWNKGQSLILERNPHYGGPKPALEKVAFKIVPEASARRLQLQNGDLDIVGSIQSDQVKAMQNASGVVFKKVPSLLVSYLYLNNKTGPLTNLELRKGIAQAVDYSGMINGIMNGEAKPLNGPIPEGMWAHDEAAPAFKTDVAAAKASIGSAAPAKPLTLLYSTKEPYWEPIVLSVQASLQAVGVQVKLEKLANATMRDRLGKGDFDISIGNWSPDFADPFMFMNYWFDSSKQGLPGNRSFYSNPEVDKLVRQAAEETDQAKRTELYQQAQKQVVKDYAYVYLFQHSNQMGLRDNVKGYAYNPMLHDVYNVADISKD